MEVQTAAAVVVVAKSEGSGGVEEAPADSGMLGEDPATGGANLKCWPRSLHKGPPWHS